MPIVLNGDGTITGLVAGGLPNNSVLTADIADDQVTIAKLASTGTASNSTFLRGDGAFAEAGGGKVLQVVTAETSTQTSCFNYIPTSTGLTASITPSATSSKILVLASSNIMLQGDNFNSSGRQIYVWLSRNGVHNTGVTLQQTRVGTEEASNFSYNPKYHLLFPLSYLDSPNTTSSTSYVVSFAKYNNNVWMYAQYGGTGKSTMTLLEIAA